MGTEKRQYELRNRQPIKIPCVACNQPTWHEVLFTAVVTDSDREVDVESVDQVLECRGCQRISFRNNWISSEDVEPDEDDQNLVPVDHETLYPSRIAGAAPMADSHLLPYQLRRIYEETHAALSANLAVLAGIGTRAIVETLCKEKQAVGPNLARKIDSLVQQGVITPDGATILHSLRLMGNRAAHEVTPHKTESLITAMQVIEHALQGVYVLPRRAARLPGAQPKAKKTP